MLVAQTNYINGLPVVDNGTMVSVHPAMTKFHKCALQLKFILKQGSCISKGMCHHYGPGWDGLTYIYICLFIVYAWLTEGEELLARECWVLPHASPCSTSEAVSLVPDWCNFTEVALSGFWFILVGLRHVRCTINLAILREYALWQYS